MTTATLRTIRGDRQTANLLAWRAVDIGACQIDAFLDELAKKSPAPGGGAVASLAAAIAGALGQMVARYSESSEAPSMSDVVSALGEMRTDALHLAEVDAEAYAAYSAKKKALKDAGGAEQDLEPEIERIIEAPLRSMELALGLLDRFKEMAPAANRWLLSDLGICAELGEAAVRSAAWNLRVNLPLLGATMGEQGGRRAEVILESAESAIVRAAEIRAEVVRVCLDRT